MVKHFTKFKPVLLLFSLLFVVAFSPSTFSQLTGTKTIPGDYATIRDAVIDLNTQGVGTGGVTFNVTAGHIESDTAGITITATGIAGNEIVFQKSGAGANPLVTRTDVGNLSTSTVGGAGDAVFRLEGTDYITFDGIDVAADSQGIEYGYLTHKPDGANGCQFVTIKNCVVTMNAGDNYVTGIYIGNGTTSTSSATGVTVTDPAGMNINITITGNTIQNVFTGIYMRGSTAMYDSSYIIGEIGAGNIVQNFSGGISTSAYGMYFIYVNSPSVEFNTITNAATPHVSTLYAIFLSVVSGDVVCSNNDLTLANNASSSSTYYIYSPSNDNCTSEAYEFNKFTSVGTIPASLYFIYANGDTPIKTVNGNTTLGTFTKNGGSTYCYYNSSSPASGMETVTNNTFSNISGGSSLFYGFYSSTASGQDRILSGNTLSNIDNSAGTSTVYSMYLLSANTSEIFNNVVSNVTGGGTVYGIYAGGTNTMIYKNTVAGLTSTTTSSSICYGAYSTTGTDVTWYNNFFSDIKAPNSTSTTAGTRGFYISSGTNVNLYYNTVYLDYTGAAGNNSASLYASTSPTAIDLRNNIFVNNVDNTAGGTNYAFYGGAITDLAATTNNNLYYAGVPSATNLIYYDGTNTAQTLTEYKTLVSPLESASVSSLPPFVNVTTTPYDLHIDTTTPTQTESGGTPVAGIITDFDGDTRNATTPDIGADEFNGIGADLTPPAIVYELLPNASATSTSVVLTANITDASGVATGTNLPRLYIKKTTDASYVFDNNPSIAGDDYTFTINYSAIGGISIGDTIEYYVAAQDVNDNVATNPAGGSGVNPPGTTPPSSPNTYLIVDVPLSGVYTVGLNLFKEKTGKNVYFETRTRTVTKNLNEEPYAFAENPIESESKTENPKPESHPQFITVTETYKELMENGQPFDKSFYQSDESRGIYPTLTEAVNDLNLRGISGPVTFQLVDTFYPNETYPIVILQTVGASSTNTITIKPASGIQTEIPGDINQTQPTIYCFDTDWLTIDGSNTTGGTTKDLKIVGLPNITVASSIYIEGDASNNVFKNLILESQETSTGFGTFVFGPGPAAMDNNIIQNCSVKNIDSIAYMPRVGVYTYSTNTGNGNQIIDCSIYDWYTYGIRLQGAPSANTLVSGCDVYQTMMGTTSPYGIYISRVDGLIVEKCKIRELIGTSTIRGIYYFGNSTSGDAIFRNNFISLSGTTNMTSGSIYGLDYFAYAANNFEAYHNSIYIGGTDVTSGSSYALTKRDDANIYKAYDNAVYNARSNGTGTGTHYGVYVSDTNTVTLELDYNDFFANGTGSSFGYYQGPGAISDLTTWQSTTGQDANSLSGDPGFVGNDDLHIQSSFNLLDGKGLYFASVPDDIDGDTRNTSTPDIGADEYDYMFVINAPSGLVADTVTGQIAVRLTWLDNSNNEDGFVIERKQGDSLSVEPFVPIDTVGTDIYTYIDNTVLLDTTYGYRVYAYSSMGNSDYSNVAYITPFVPVELTSFTALVNNRKILINWATATETNNQGFDIERKMNTEWEKIGYVEGKGTTTDPQVYSFVDKYDFKSYKGIITYRLKQIDFDGTYEYSNEINVDVDFTPKEYTLYQNYPNPFNPSTTIKFALPYDSHVKIFVYSILGELISTIVDEVKEVGYYDFVWNASNYASGVYIYTIQAKSVDGKNSYNKVKKMMLMK